MEEYETFCKKQLARIQGESLKSELSPIPPQNLSLIQFNAVPVLSPLLTLERKKELQQDRQKALDLEQNFRKRILLTRVEEIVANVQMKKMPSRSYLDQSEKEDIGSKVLNGLAMQSCQVLPNSTDGHGSLESKLTTGLKETDAQGGSDGSSPGGEEQLNILETEEACKRLSEKRPCPEGTFSSLSSPSPSNAIEKKDAADLDLPDTEGPDRYVMSLQSLLKRSREYVQKEQTRRSLRSSSKRGGHDSHPNKENSAVQMNELAKERGKFMGRSATVPALEKSSQSPSFPKNHASVITSSSFSKVGVSVRSASPPVLDSDSDEDFKSLSLFEQESSILHSLTGSYTKLPSPEPSLSPKMHRRRPHPSSVGHIVITDPVNAYELSPKGKGSTADSMGQAAGERQMASDPVLKLSTDFVPTGPHAAQALGISCPGVFSEPAVGRCSEVCQLPADQQESHGFPVNISAEGELLSEGGRALSGCVLNSSPHELQDGSCLLLTHNPTDVSMAQDRVKGSGPVALNRSYDVANPSPLLTQTQSEPQLDTPAMLLGRERVLENGLERVKRRLELEMAEGVQKENLPWVVSAEASKQEGQRLHDQRHPGRAAFDTKSETLARSFSEEALRQKVLALAELRQRLEEQHAQQLALLIAEQEREQERLQKEIEEQERRLKQEKNTPGESDVSRMADSSGLGLEWRKISDTHLLDSVLTRVEAVHHTSPENAGFVKSGLPAGAPFYLWEPPASGKSVLASRNINRNKMRWSQVYSPEMKRKLNKISALAKGFLTRRLLQTEKLKHLRQTVHDTMEFIRNFQSETILKRGNVPAQDANLQARVVAQLQAALYDIHDIFFKMEASERMNILRHDREVRKEKMLRQLDKAKSPRERVTLSTATQKSLDRKKYIKASELGIPNKKTTGKQKTPENRVLQPNQGQNAPIQRLLSRQGTPKASGKGEEQNRKKPPDSRVRNKARSGVYAGRIPKRKPSVVTT